MINLNIFVGLVLFILGVLSVLLSFAIAVKKYVLTLHGAMKLGGASLPDLDIIKVFLELLGKILAAPPALAFFVGGLLLLGGGGSILYIKPF